MAASGILLSVFKNTPNRPSTEGMVSTACMYRNQRGSYHTIQHQLLNLVGCRGLFLVYPILQMFMEPLKQPWKSSSHADGYLLFDCCYCVYLYRNPRLPHRSPRWTTILLPQNNTHVGSFMSVKVHFISSTYSDGPKNPYPRQYTANARLTPVCCINLG